MRRSGSRRRRRPAAAGSTPATRTIPPATVGARMTDPQPKPPFSLVGIDHVVFLVDDMQRALKFYGEVLGCERGYSYPKLGMEQVWCGSALIVLWDTTHPGAT